MSFSSRKGRAVLSLLLLLAVSLTWPAGSLAATPPTGPATDYQRPAGTLVLRPDSHYHILAPHATFFKDKAGTLTIDDIRSGEEQLPFRKFSRDFPNLGLSDAAYWIKIRVKNRSPVKEWVIELASPGLRFIDFYSFSEAGTSPKRVIQTGTMRPAVNRDAGKLSFGFRLNFADNAEKAVYIRVRNTILDLPLRIYTAETFQKTQFKRDLLTALFLGMVLLLGFYHALLSLFVKETSYFLYSIAIFFLFLFFLNHDGFLVYFFRDQYLLFTLFYPVIYFGGNFVILVFSMLFLQTRELAPRLHQGLWVLALSSLLFLALVTIIDRGDTFRLIFVFTNITNPVLMLAGARVWRKGYKPATYFFTGWLLWGLSAFWTALVAFGVLPQPDFSLALFPALKIGTLLQMVFMGLALADRIKFLQRKKDFAEREVRESQALNQAKDLLLANFSHELRSPLNIIIGLARQILKRDPDAGTRKDLKAVLGSGQYLLKLINQVLDMARIRAGRARLDEDWFSVAELWRELETLYGHENRRTRTRFSMLGGRPAAPHTYGDELKLKQVLMNLIENAQKFTPEGDVFARLTINPTDHGRASLQFEISDTGPGIHQSELTKIFTPFRQVGDRSNNPDGLGLGLSICQEYLHLMGAEITVESTTTDQSPQNHGTVFRFALTVPASDSPWTGDRPSSEGLEGEREKMSAASEPPAIRPDGPADHFRDIIYLLDQIVSVAGEGRPFRVEANIQKLSGLDPALARWLNQFAEQYRYEEMITEINKLRKG